MYIGTSFFCPCCGGHFHKFLPAGVQQRPNAKCPRCFSLERHRLILLYLKNKTNFFTDNLKVLHFSPNFSLQRIFKSMPNIDYISADLYSSTVRIKIDITNILYKYNTFDVILCSHILEHVIDDQKAIK